MNFKAKEKPRRVTLTPNMDDTVTVVDPLKGKVTMTYGEVRNHYHTSASTLVSGVTVNAIARTSKQPFNVEAMKTARVKYYKCTRGDEIYELTPDVFERFFLRVKEDEPSMEKELEELSKLLTAALVHSNIVAERYLKSIRLSRVDNGKSIIAIQPTYRNGVLLYATSTGEYFTNSVIGFSGLLKCIFSIADDVCKEAHILQVFGYELENKCSVLWLADNKLLIGKNATVELVIGEEPKYTFNVTGGVPVTATYDEVDINMLSKMAEALYVRRDNYVFIDIFTLQNTEVCTAALKEYAQYFADKHGGIVDDAEVGVAVKFFNNKSIATMNAVVTETGVAITIPPSTFHFSSLFKGI